MKTHAMTTLALLVASAGLTGCSKDGKRTTGPTGPSTSVSTLRVSTEWSGDHPDSDGYTIAIDGVARGAIGLNESRTIELPAGEYDVTLEGVAATCDVEDGIARSVIATEGGTVDVHFSVVGLDAVRNRIVIHNDDGARRSLYMLREDGSGTARFPLPLDAVDCTVSGDGRWIAFSTPNGGVWVMRADGTELNQISDEGRSPAWRSAGSMQIAFVEADDEGMSDIWAINYDGSGRTNLTNTPDRSEHSPAWSPTGLFIAYERRTPEDQQGVVSDSQIYVAQFNGSFPRDLIPSPAGGDGEYEMHPVWSPDGQKIAYASARRHPGEVGDGHGDMEIHVVNADGTNDRFLTDDDRRNTGPSWSGDGSQILYTAQRESGSTSVFIMSANGSGHRPLAFDAPSGQNWTFTRSWVH